MSLSVWTITVCLMALVATAPVHAQTAVSASPDADYRPYITVADGAAAGLTLSGVGFLSRSGGSETLGKAMVAAGVVTFLVGGPTLHFVHDQSVRAGISLALRVALPLVGFTIGLAHPGCHREGDCSSTPAFAGLATGALAASVTDVLIPLWFVTPSPPPPSPATPVSLAPGLSLSGDRAMVGLGGSF